MDIICLRHSFILKVVLAVCSGMAADLTQLPHQMQGFSLNCHHKLLSPQSTHHHRHYFPIAN